MNIDTQVRKERLKLLYKQSPGLLVGLFTSGTAIFLFALLTNNEIDATILHGWYICLIVLIIFRGLLLRAFNKASHANLSVDSWVSYFAIAIFFSGLLIGSTSVLFIDFDNPVSPIFISIVIFGTLAGSLGALSNFRFLYYLYGLLSISPLATVFYIEGGSYPYLSILLIVFLLAFFFFATNFYQVISSSIEQKFLNLDLIEKLESQTHIAEQASVDKSRFLAATSHDLRQPLHSLGLFLSVLKSKLNQQEQIAILDKAQHSQKVLSGQLNSIIEMTQLDGGEITLAKEYIQLDEFVEEIIEEFKLPAKQNNITIKTNLKAFTVFYDAVLLGRIIRNLVSNVLQHCPNSTLLITLRKRQSGLELCFIDNGPGIRKTEQQDVFSEFVQLKNPERDRNKGMGLGLAIVKRLADLLDIPVRLRSKVGKGSTFQLLLTESTSKANNAITPATTDLSPSEINQTDAFAGKFIVVVDDDEDILIAMREILLGWHCEVLLAQKYTELLDMLNRDNYPLPDLLIVDYRLNEDLNGVQVIKKVSDYFQQQIPAVIISGDVTLGIESLLEGSQARVFYKPVSIEGLTRILHDSFNSQ